MSVLAPGACAELHRVKQVVNGEFCWNVTLGDLGIGLTNGSLVTLQIQYNGVSLHGHTTGSPDSLPLPVASK